MKLHLSMQLFRNKSALIVGALITGAMTGCSSVKAPDFVNDLSLPDIRLAENEPTFKKRLYAGASVGTATLKPDTRGTVFGIDNSSSQASQLRIGMDLHNQFAVELETAILGRANTSVYNNGEFIQEGRDVSYTAASVSTLFYGLTGVRDRSTRTGFSGFGRLGYSLVQRASSIIPLDKTDSGLFVGIGAEYGFQNGMALRAELTRLSSDATVMGIGGIYRFGMAPKSIGRVFVDAAKPALSSAHTRVASDGRVLSGVRESSVQMSSKQTAKTVQPSPTLAIQQWTPKVSKHDLDGDGVKNAQDACADTAPRTTVNKNGCGMFDAVLSDVTFKSGSSWLTPKARGVLDAVSETLLAFPEARVQVRAHTDSDGPADLNLGLSARRAESVVEYLVEKGIHETQLETLGLGESQPLDSNDTAEGKERNRRVELMTLPNLTELNTGNNVDIAEQQDPAPVTIKSIDNAVKATRSLSAEPVFPPMSGVKIEALPRSEFVAGLALGGILEGVEFTDGSATLSGESKSVLANVHQKLVRFPQVKLVVMGHTDNQRSAEESKSLSTKRANVVVNHLISLGVASSRLSAEGFGSSLPVAQNLTDADRKRNERIELRVQK